MKKAAKKSKKASPKKTKTTAKVNSEGDLVRHHYNSGLRLLDKVAIMTGGDSGIGRAVAMHFALEGANVAIVYRKSDDDARETQAMIEKTNQTCILFKGDISNESFCRKVVRDTHKEFKPTGYFGEQRGDAHSGG